MLLRTLGLQQAGPTSKQFSLRMLQSWIRNFLLCAAVYYGIGAVWSLYIYICFGTRLFRPGGIPRVRDMVEQMKVNPG